ncbi:MAG: NUMOD4 domain-containing protein [Candidatus Paceibacterota bacterium]
MHVIKPIWLPVPNYEGEYEVSNIGSVCVLDKIKISKWGKVRIVEGFILKQQTHNGYKTVSLNGKRFRVHRLVASAFLENPHNHPVVNHKDKIRDNNNVDNLEWCTYKYNNIHAGAGKEFIKLRKKVFQYDLELNLIKEHVSIRQATLINQNLNRYDISACCKGLKETYNGFIWSYKQIN